METKEEILREMMLNKPDLSDADTKREYTYKFNFLQTLLEIRDSLNSISNSLSKRGGKK